MGKLEHLPFEFETAETMLHLLGPGVPGASFKTVTRQRHMRGVLARDVKHAILDRPSRGYWSGCRVLRVDIRIRYSYHI
jgi:hypothetical protein